MVSSKDTHDLVLNAGHIGIVAGGIAAKMLWPGVDKWLSKRSM
jgi:polyhydroxyalkanoate synthase